MRIIFPRSTSRTQNYDIVQKQLKKQKIMDHKKKLMERGNLLSLKRKN